VNFLIVDIRVYIKDRLDYVRNIILCKNEEKHYDQSDDILLKINEDCIVLLKGARKK
jgi:hypothetical protein